MATTITDLDAVLGEDKKVRLGGKVYLLPADIPVELYLQVNQAAAQENVTETEMIQSLYTGLLELFRQRQPDLESLPLTLSQAMRAISLIYGGGDEGDAARPPRTRGGASSKSRTAARSRS